MEYDARAGLCLSMAKRSIRSLVASSASSTALGDLDMSY